MKKPVLVILISCIFAIVSAELFLRWFKPIYFCNTVLQFRYDKDLGVSTRANFHKSFLTDHIIEVFTNDIGTRNYLNKADLLRYKKIVFCVGDSYTEGTGNLTDQSYPFYLDLLLNRDKNTGAYEKNFAVVNLGLGAYGSMQSYLAADIYAKKLGRLPDAIIYFSCANDPADDAAFKNGDAFRFIVKDSPLYSPFIVTLTEMLEEFQLWKRIKLLMPFSLDKRRFIGAYAKKKQFDPRVDLPGLMPMADFAKKNNIKFILSYTNYKNNEYDILKKFAEDNSINFADFKPDVEGVAAVAPELPVTNRHSGGHYRSWVNFIIAGKFAQFFGGAKE